jgi:hypothetical protein
MCLCTEFYLQDQIERYLLLDLGMKGVEILKMIMQKYGVSVLTGLDFELLGFLSSSVLKETPENSILETGSVCPQVRGEALCWVDRTNLNNWTG